MAKKKKTKSTITGWTEANEVLRKMTIAEVTADALEAEMDMEFYNITNKYLPLIQEERNTRAELAEDLELFCIKNKNDFEGKKSKALLWGKVGFRNGKPGLKLLKGFSWDMVKRNFNELFKLKYVTVKITLNKSRILEDAASEAISAPDLEYCGVKTGASERFYFETNIERLEETDGN